MNSSTTDPHAPSTLLAEIRIPRETVNDDVVTIQSWRRAHGNPVKVRDVLVDIETSKAVLEVEAEADGFLEIIHPQGAEVAIGELIGRVLSEAPSQSEPSGASRRPAFAEPPAASSNGLASPPQTQAPKPQTPSSNRLRDRQTASPQTQDPNPQTPSLPDRTSSQAIISKKAQRLIDEHRIDAAAAFAGIGMVREADVIRHLEAQAADRMSRSPEPASPATRVVADRAAAQAAPPPAQAGPSVDAVYPGARARGLLGDAAASAKDRGNKSVLWLAWNYFWRNWLLGNLARWAPRGVILPIHRLRGVKMGSDVFIDPTAIIETAFPENITIGNDVRITAGCVIMSHIKAPHYLRETGLVPVVLKPVILEDHCFIGVNSVIMPGVTIGKASVVTSGSVVVTNVPPYSMVQGNPAKVIKSFPKPEGIEGSRDPGIK